MPIESRVLSYTISHLIELTKEGRINLFPKFQRDLVWNDTHKSRFIETILMGLPFPEIFLSRSLGNLDVYEVVDGQQRLGTIFQYVAGSPEFRVKGIKNFEDLGVSEKRSFLEYPVVIRDLLIENETEIYEVFERINSVRYALNAIELTNALYEGEFIKTARDIADSEVFGNMEVFSESEFTRKKDLEFVLLVMATVEEGGYFAGTKEVELFVKKYDAEYPKSDQMRASFQKAVDLIRRSDFKPDSLWLRRANLFTLIVELISLLNKGANFDSWRLALALADFEGKLMKNRNENRESNNFAAYYYYLYESTNTRSGRHSRGKMLRSFLESLTM
jgi:Protein of unknown function DUF262